MAQWSILEWLLLQFAVLAALGSLGFGIAFQMSKSRIRRLQKEFKTLAVDMGEAIANASSEQGVHFDSLLMQTQAYLQSQGLSIPWQQVDPLQYPELLPLFLRCAALDTEHAAFDYMGGDEYWPRITAAYDQVLFEFSRSSQESSVNTRAVQRRLDESEELSGILRGRVATLEAELQRAKDNVMHQGVGESHQDESHQGEFALEASSAIFVDKAGGVSDVNTTEQHATMLSNIIEDQKSRIKSMEKDLQQLRSHNESRDQGERGLEVKKKEKSIELLEEQNRTLTEQLIVFEKSMAFKDLELTQLLDQMDTVSNSQSHAPPDEVLMQRALVEAWLNTEKSLAAFEHQVLSRFGK